MHSNDLVQATVGTRIFDDNTNKIPANRMDFLQNTVNLKQTTLEKRGQVWAEQMTKPGKWINFLWWLVEQAEVILLLFCMVLA